MSRAPYVVPKPDEAVPRTMEMVSTTLGWRLVNPAFPAQWTQSLGACAEQVAAELGIGRAEQDAWALRSHELAAEAWDKGLHDDYVLTRRRRHARRVDPSRHVAGQAGRARAGLLRRTAP